MALGLLFMAPKVGDWNAAMQMIVAKMQSSNKLLPQCKEKCRLLVVLCAGVHTRLGRSGVCKQYELASNSIQFNSFQTPADGLYDGCNVHQQ